MKSGKEIAARATALEVLEDVGISQIPVDPLEVVQAKEILFEEKNGFPRGIYGMCYQHQGRLGIAISVDCHGPGHRAFTIAHELGHYSLPGHYEAMFAMGSTQVPSQGGHFRTRKEPREMEADWFASELLMPEWAAARDVIRIDASAQGVADLATRYKVSLPCAAVRLAELTDEAVVVIISHQGEVEWLARSDRVFEHDWSRRLIKGDWLPPKSCSAILAQKPNDVLAGRRQDGRSLLTEWFSGAPPMTFASEEAVGLGSWGRVMTVLKIEELPTADELEEEAQRKGERESRWGDSMRGFRWD